jgi:hypothetical protein
MLYGPSLVVKDKIFLVVLIVVLAAHDDKELKEEEWSFLPVDVVAPVA